MALACPGIPGLGVDDFLADALEVLRACFRRQGQACDPSVGGGADLAQRDERIFSPAGARFVVPETGDSPGRSRDVAPRLDSDVLRNATAPVQSSCLPGSAPRASVRRRR